MSFGICFNTVSMMKRTQLLVFLLSTLFTLLITLTLTLTLSGGAVSPFRLIPSTSSLSVTLHTVLSAARNVHLLSKVLSLLSRHCLLLSLSWCTILAVAAYVFTRPRPVLLLDYVCFKPDDGRKLPMETCEYFVRRSGRYSTSSEDFMRSIYLKSGLGHETYGPPFIFQVDYEAKLKSAIEEADEGMFASVEAVLGKSRVRADQIDILVVTCGMFSPCPSLSARLVSRFDFLPSVRTFNLTAMGCSAGTTATDMASRLLSSSRKVGYALVVITENISLNWYFGDDRSMLVTNCIFRVGTAAVLVTNDPARRGDAKMELLRSLVTHHGDDAAYGVVMQQEDANGELGVTLKRELVQVAEGRLRDHLRILAPRVLPLTEIVSYCCAVLKAQLAAAPRRKALSGPGGKNSTKAPVLVDVPDFTTAFEHMCVHAGGRAVVDGVEKAMRLPESAVEPARMTLHRFGNSSGPLVFYELAYFEAKGRIRKGDRMWMVSFGAGFIVCSLVWKALRAAEEDDPCNPWNDSLDRYPVEI